VTDRRFEDRCHLCRAGYVDAFDRLLWSLGERIAEAPPGESRQTRVREAVVGLGRERGVEVRGTAITGRVPL
jgi:hypothetical protein